MAYPGKQTTVGRSAAVQDLEDYFMSSRIFPPRIAEKIDSGDALLETVRKNNIGTLLSGMACSFAPFYKNEPAESTGVAANWLLFEEDISEEKTYTFTIRNFNLEFFTPRVLKCYTEVGESFDVTFSGPSYRGKRIGETVTTDGTTEKLTNYSYRGAKRREADSGLSFDTATMVADELIITVTGAAGRTLTVGLSEYMGLPVVPTQFVCGEFYSDADTPGDYTYGLPSDNGVITILDSKDFGTYLTWRCAVTTAADGVYNHEAWSWTPRSADAPDGAKSYSIIYYGVLADPDEKEFEKNTV